MNDAEHLAKLEALLARVRSRSRILGASFPFPSPVATAAPGSGIPPLAPKPPLAPQPPPAPQPPLAPPPAAFPSPLPPPLASPPPPSPPPPRPKHTSRPEVPLGLFVMGPEIPIARHADPFTRNGAVTAPPDPPPMEVVELEVDPDPSIAPPPVDDQDEQVDDDWLEDTRPSGASLFSRPPPPEPPSPPVKEPLESRSRLVAAAPVLPDEPPESLPEESDDAPGYVPSDPTIEVAAAAVSQGDLDAIEEDLAPSSSRRPISIEEKMSEPEDSIPLHLPPPKSGSLPAATPSIELTRDAPAEPAVNVVRVEPARAEVAVFVVGAKGELAAKTFGELLDEALAL